MSGPAKKAASLPLSNLPGSSNKETGTNSPDIVVLERDIWQAVNYLHCLSQTLTHDLFEIVGLAFSQLGQKHEREPNSNELAEELNMSEFQVADTLKISGRHVSVDAPLFQGEENRWLDIMQDDHQVAPDSILMDESLKEEVKQALATLSERESEVILLYYGLHKDRSLTLEEIGEKFNLTRERVRQIKEKAIRRLQHTSRSKNLRTYLG